MRAVTKQQKPRKRKRKICAEESDVVGVWNGSGAPRLQRIIYAEPSLGTNAPFARWVYFTKNIRTVELNFDYDKDVGGTLRIYFEEVQDDIIVKVSGRSILSNLLDELMLFLSSDATTVKEKRMIMWSFLAIRELFRIWLNKFTEYI